MKQDDIIQDGCSALSGQIWTDLASTKQQVLEAIQVAAKESNTEALFKANDWLRTCTNIERNRDALVNEASDAVSHGRDILHPKEANPTDQVEDSELSDVIESGEDISSGGSNRGGKARGRECRHAFVRRETQRGNALRGKGQLFRNPAGAIVGIAYGEEKKERRNTWFLGLPAGAFQTAVLLCETQSEKIKVFRLPASFIQRYGRNLSVSKKFNQAKFRVDLRGSHYELSTTVGPVDITEYLDAETLDCPRLEFA